MVRAAFAAPGGDAQALSVPIAALDERGQGPRVWQVVDGRAQPVTVEILALDAEAARVQGGLKAGDRSSRWAPICSPPAWRCGSWRR